MKMTTFGIHKTTVTDAPEGSPNIRVYYPGEPLTSNDERFLIETLLGNLTRQIDDLTRLKGSLDGK